MSVTDLDVSPAEVAGLGACVLANDLPFSGMGGEIFSRRVKGMSWKQIADELGLGTPSKARTTFTKLTGITDYKIKGDELMALAQSGLDPKLTAPKIKKAKVKPEVAGINDDQLIEWAIQAKTIAYQDLGLTEIELTPSLKQVFSSWMSTKKMTIKEKKFLLGDIGPGDLDPFEIESLFKKIDEKPPAQLTAAIKHAKKSVKSMTGFDDVAEKVASGKADIPKELGVSGEQIVIDKWKAGNGSYQQLASASGLTIEQVDQIVWKQAMEATEGHVWKAHKIKPNSQIGIKSVYDMVYELRSHGYTVAQIVDHTGISKDAVHQILNGTWKPSPFFQALPKHPEYTPPASATASSFGRRPAKYGTEDFPLLGDYEMANLHSPPLQPTIEKAVRYYTGSGYYGVNDYLRKGFVFPEALDKAKKTIERMDKAMFPTKKPMTVTRGMNLRGLVGETDVDPKSLVGAVISDRAFMSTSIAPDGVFKNAVRLVMEVPEGARGYYARPISTHKSEYEFILARDTQMMVTAVEELETDSKYGEKWKVTVRVIVPE